MKVTRARPVTSATRPTRCIMHASGSGTRSIEARMAEPHARFTTRPGSLSVSCRPCIAMQRGLLHEQVFERSSTAENVLFPPRLTRRRAMLSS